MIIKLYWITRIIGYVASLAGIFYYLYHQADVDPRTAQCGLAAVGFGFVAFFISYALRVWIRYSVRRSAGEDQRPGRNPM